MSDVRAWPKMTGVMTDAPRRIARPCDYGLVAAVVQLEVQLGSVEAYNRLVEAAERLRLRIKNGNGHAQNPIYAVDIHGKP